MVRMTTTTPRLISSCCVGVVIVFKDICCNQEFKTEHDLVGQFAPDLVVSIRTSLNFQHQDVNDSFQPAIDDQGCPGNAQYECKKIDDVKECRQLHTH